MSPAGEAIIAIVILVGLIGIIVPLLPGSILVLGAIAFWAFLEGTALAWTAFAIGAALIGAAGIVKYTWPGKRLSSAGMPKRTLLLGVVLGIVGFFVIPIVGLPIGFVIGVYLSELQRHRSAQLAGASTIAALKAVGLSMLVELVGATLAAMVWLAAVVAG